MEHRLQVREFDDVAVAAVENVGSAVGGRRSFPRKSPTTLKHGTGVSISNLREPSAERLRRHGSGLMHRRACARGDGISAMKAISARDFMNKSLSSNVVALREANVD